MSERREEAGPSVAGPVSRGTGDLQPTGAPGLAEPPTLSAAVARCFAQRPEGVALARRYAGHLATSGVDRGLVGPREVDRLWERHVLNCALVAPLLPPAASVVDVGSGAGLPGLVLALARPDVAVTLVEPLERRVTWLREVVGDLGLAVRVVRARADEVVRPGPDRVAPADVVTARAVAPLERLAGWCLPLVREGGELLALKGRSAPDELLAAEPALRRLGATRWRIERVDAPGIVVPTTVVRVTVGPPPQRGARADRAERGTPGSAPGAGGPRRARRTHREGRV